MKFGKNEILRVTYKDCDGNIKGYVTENPSTKIFFRYNSNGDREEKSKNPNDFNDFFYPKEEVKKRGRPKKCDK